MFAFVLCASGMASYTVVTSFMNYFAYGVTTTTRTFFETPSLFPKVTICNINPFTTQYAFNFLLGLNSSVMNAKPNSTYSQSSAQMYDLYYMAQGIVKSPNFADKNRTLLAHSLDEILISCRFNGKTCNSSDFIRTFDPFYGNCYIFNSGLNSAGDRIDLKHQSLSSDYYGLHAELYSGFYEKLNTLNAYNGGLGLLIRVDNASYLTDHMTYGIRISTGLHTDIIVERSFKFMLPRPYSNCEIDSDSSKTTYVSDIYNMIAQSKYEYTQQLCLSQCYQKLMIDECNCTDTLLSLYDVNVCATDEETNCVDETLFDIYLRSEYIERVCMPLCPLQCNTTEYKTRLASHRLKGDLYAKYIGENQNLSADFVSETIDARTARESVTSVNIFYDSLSYTASTESPQLDIVGLLASIGGNLGLFLGMSLLSVCELLEIFFEIYLLKNSTVKRRFIAPK